MKKTKKKKKFIRGKLKPGVYDSEDEAKAKVGELSRRSRRRFAVQQDFTHTGKWVIIELWGHRK